MCHNTISYRWTLANLCYEHCYKCYYNRSNTSQVMKQKRSFHFTWIWSLWHVDYFLLSFATLVWNILRSSKCWISYARVKIQMFAETYVGLRVKYPSVSTDFKKNCYCRTTLRECLPRRNKICVRSLKCWS